MIAQIEAFRPDVILNQAMHFIGANPYDRWSANAACWSADRRALAPARGRSRLRSDRHLAAKLRKEIRATRHQDILQPARICAEAFWRTCRRPRETWP